MKTKINQEAFRFGPVPIPEFLQRTGFTLSLAQVRFTFAHMTRQ